MATDTKTLTGTVSWFNGGKGYGFISRNDGEDDLFVHFSHLIMDGYKVLKQGQKVRFSIGKGTKGNPSGERRDTEIIMAKLKFTAFVHPEPQGSVKAFMIGGKPRLTTDNTKLKPFRSEVTRCAMVAASDSGIELPMAGKHIPVLMEITFYIKKGLGLPKKRIHPSVKPDIDKLLRAVLDSLTGVAYLDDGQVVGVSARKLYGSPERVEVRIEEI